MDKVKELQNRVLKEYGIWIYKTLQKSPQAILNSAYEKVFYNELVFLLSGLDDEDAEVLLQLPSIIDYLYNSWLRVDGGFERMRAFVRDEIQELHRKETDNG